MAALKQLAVITKQYKQRLPLYAAICKVASQTWTMKYR